MHNIEPFWLWRDLYISAEDERSPLYNRLYNEFEYTNTVYNYVIHPQWDFIGSSTLYLKIIYVDYALSYAIIELMGEWNDCIYNDIMFFKRNIIEPMMQEGINKFILVGENIFNFHASDDCYYEEWHEEIEDGWITPIHFRKHVIDEFKSQRIHYYINFNETINALNWRTYQPNQLFCKVESLIKQNLLP